MRAKLMFIDGQGTELQLPVTPANYKISYGQKIETVNLHTLGDVIFGGANTLATINIDCIFPAEKRSYSNGTPMAQQAYISTFKRWIDLQAVIRFVISESDVNIPVLIEEIAYGKSGGNGDIKATLILREFRFAKTSVAGTQSANSRENGENSAAIVQTAQVYEVKAHDTLSAICRKFYGDSSAKIYKALAEFNGIKNPNLIYTTQIIKIPPKAQLLR